MHNWRNICAGITVVILIAALAVSCFGSPFIHFALRADTQSFLQELGYQQSDITNMKTLYKRNAEKPYMASCTLEGTEITHYFAYNADGLIQEVEEADI